MLLIVFALQAVALPSRQIEQYGLGTSSCATAMNTSADARASWVLGFWTGMNVALGRRVGRATDGRGILGEVERRCANVPSRPLAEITLATYRQMAGEGQ